MKVLKQIEMSFEGMKFKAMIENTETLEVRRGKNGRILIAVIPKVIENVKVSGIPIFPGFKRVYDVAPGQFVIKNEADGSYFTWIPVSDEIIKSGFGRLNLRDNIFNNDNFHEDITEELSKIRKFIGKYRGFYKASYPASKGNNGLPKFVPNADVWTNICYRDSSKKTDIVRVVKKYAKILSDGVKFCVTPGELYDYTCQSIIDRGLKTFDEVVKDSSNWGNYNNNENGILLKTGENPEYMVAGLYGLAGCVWEITQELYNNKCIVVRGGSFVGYGDYNPASFRSYLCTGDAGSDVGFGGVLYASTDICYPTEMLDIKK